MSTDAAPKVLIFDVNETLLDINSLEPLFSRLFGDKHVLREWFAQLVLYSQALTLANLYATYSQIGVGALRMIAKTSNVAVGESDAEELRSRMRDLPAHSEVQPLCNVWVKRVSVW
jgi:2-haloacid dehalogenase